MSAKLYGFSPGTIIPQPDFAARLTEHNTWEGSQSFKILTSDWDNPAVRNKFAPKQPIWPLWGTSWNSVPAEFRNMYIVKSEPRITVGGLMMVAVTLSMAEFNTFGTDPDSPTQGLPIYSLEGSLTEVSVLEHPKVVDLADKQRALLKKLYDGQIDYNAESDVYYEWDEGGQSVTEVTFTAGDSADFAELIRMGEGTYLRPSFLWRETREGSTALGSSQINQLGDVDVPPGSPPTPSGSRDWLMSGANQETFGNTYRTQREWTLSEKDGWNTLKYTT